jgi:hypothetical protein
MNENNIFLKWRNKMVTYPDVFDVIGKVLKEMGLDVYDLNIYDDDKVGLIIVEKGTGRKIGELKIGLRDDTIHCEFVSYDRELPSIIIYGIMIEHDIWKGDEHIIWFGD